jgi:hypothetical protein
MKEQIYTTDEALSEVFNLDNESLSKQLNTNYNTVASWKFNFRHNAMSYEKKIEILNRINFKFIEQSKWKKQVK